MYRRYAVKLNKKQVEFINCVNMVERVKRARGIPGGVEHLGVKRYVVSSTSFGKKRKGYLKAKDCA